MLLGQVIKQPSEIFPITVTFSSELAANETVSSAVVSARNAKTGTSSSAIVLSGNPTLSSSAVTQVLMGGVSNTSHVLTFKATTTLGNVYEGEVSLLIKED